MKCKAAYFSDRPMIDMQARRGKHIANMRQRFRWNDSL